MNLKNSKGVESNLLPLYLKNKSLGKVQSKFQSGFNIKFGDELVYISFVGSPLSAFGINIEKDELFRILKLIVINDVVIYKRDNIIIYTLKEIIYLNLKNIDKVNLRIPKISTRVEEIKNTYLYNILDKFNFEDYIGIDFEVKTKTHIDLLIIKAKNNRLCNEKIINFFAGRGKGLTPSGDDILIGFTMGLMTFNTNRKFDNWIKDINQILVKEKTTLVSIAYVKALTRGYLSENFLELINSFDEKDKNKVLGILEKVKLYGHTSGYDTLFGFYLSLKYLTKN